MLFVRATFPHRNISQNMLNDLKRKSTTPNLKPILQVTNKQDDIIIEIIEQFKLEIEHETHCITILVPLVNAALHVKKTVDYYFRIISQA